MKPLVIVPTYLRRGHELALTEACLKSLRATAGDACDVLLVDDGSPERDLVDGLRHLCETYDAELVAKETNGGFSATVNVGLARCRDEGRDAVLCNNDIQFRPDASNWLQLMVNQQRKDGEGLASVVGALLVYPNALIQHAGIFFCHPGEQTVLTVQDGEVPIAELTGDHGLVSYARKENRIFRAATYAGRRRSGSGRCAGGYPWQRSQRRYLGEMLCLRTRRRQTHLTPNHYLTAFWNERALAGYAVYLMRRGRHWRVGHSKMRIANSGFGPRMRMDQNDADALWILEIVDDKASAIERESLLAWSYGVPTWQFRLSGTPGITQERQDALWNAYRSDEGAFGLLDAYGRLRDHPLVEKREGLRDSRRALVGQSRRYEIAACNLIPGAMEVPEDPGDGQHIDRQGFEIERYDYAGTVFGLEVPPHHHYVSGGIVVHNSYLTRTFDHRYRFGPGNLSEAQRAAVMPVTGALQFIRLECLQEVGIYDESFRLGYEDVDYNVRVWLSGRQCVYQPGVRALHHESATRGQKSAKIDKWEDESWLRFCGKWADTSFAEWIPMLTLAAE